ncbi:MAG: tRNA 2-thiouridine(34) synthase MnmA [Alphaproteobacteria bacterium]
MNFLHINKNIKDTKIVVAMSGGVDSSTVAAMLHEQGYQVIGVTLQLYDLGVTLEKKGACCAGQDIYDAKTVADKLNIPHYVLNYESIFKQSVIEDFADSYLRGETPIPCVRCNQSVKFKDLFKVAKDLGADALVTGHYVRKINKPTGFELHRAVDQNKDQSYFLFATTKEQLEYIDFPLGVYKKDEIRNLATKYGLKVADKPDSQDICFVAGGSYSNIIEKIRPGALDEGEIINIEGKILGKHKGIINYTIGQRRGLNISSSEPLYVVKINATKNQIVVGSEQDLYNSNFLIKDINWLANEEIPEEGITAHVKLRSAHKPVKATIYKFSSDYRRVLLDIPEKAITPGQACVVYDEERVLGGGWITEIIN